MIYIPIGLDCSAATFLKDKNLRLYSLPFDWTVTYSGVSDIIKDKFRSYIPMNNEKHSCNTYFVHHTFPNDTEKINRRVQRFLNLLDSKTEELIFIRKGHSQRHHEEALDRNCQIKNDLIDVEELNEYLTQNYPDLKFKIIVFVFCVDCFNDEITSISKNIMIYYVKTTNVDEEYPRFLEGMTKLLSLLAK